MLCNQSHLLSPYLDGELSSAEASAVARHLASCSACSAEADELRAVSRLMVAARAGLASHSLGPTADETDEVMGRLRLHVQDLVGSVDTSLIWMARIFSGVAACILIGGLWLLSAANHSARMPVAGTDLQAVQLSLMPDPVADLSADGLVTSTTPVAAEPTTRESVLARLTGIGDGSAVAEAASTEDDNR